MSIFTVAIVLSFIAYFIIGNFIGRKVKTLDEFYVAGRQAPTALIVGSLAASLVSTGMFLGDCGETYSGLFAIMISLTVLTSVGFPVGTVMFGKYIRRSQALTVPSYYSKRFNDPKIQKLSGFIIVFICFIYMFSVMDGVSLVMDLVTSLGRPVCLILTWATFTFFVMTAGSKGVILTDTIMAVFMACTCLLGLPFIIHGAGGWFEAMRDMATLDLGIENFMGYGGNPLLAPYPDATQSFIWSLVYGFVWAIVVTVAPWQTSRYLMAKNEHTVVRSGAYACMFLVFAQVCVLFSAAVVRLYNAGLADQQTVMLYAAEHLMPVALGVLVVVGIAAAGVSSASTFLSLIGFALINDIIYVADEQKRLRITRWSMLIVSTIVLILNMFKPPMVFWITQFGGSIAGAAFFVVSIASVWWPRLTARGAFMGVLFGFGFAVITRAYTLIAGVTLPVAADPFLVGIYASIIGMLIGTYTSQVTQQEKEQLALLHVIPKEEMVASEMKRTKAVSFCVIIVGILAIIALVFLWAHPYTQASFAA